MRAGAYNRTCEAIAVQHEDLQIDQFAELLGQFSCKKKMKMSANIQRMYAGTYNRTCQFVPEEPKCLQIGQLPKFDGNSSYDSRKV